MAEDYLATEAREKRNQLINDARMNRFNNIVSNSINGTLPSGDEMLDRVSGIVGVNGKPTGNSGTPTVNRGVYPPGMNVWFGVPGNLGAGNTSRTIPTVVGQQPTGNGVWFTNQQNGQQYQPFSVADTLAQRAQGYQAQGLEGLANSYKTLNRENNIYNNTANKITDYYTALANDINSRENALAQRKESLANQLSQDIANNRQYVMDYFGPNGIFTNEINKFYDENGNYLASEAGRQMAMANAEGIQSGASLGAQRAARNEAYNNAFKNYLKVKEQEINAKMNIQTQLINYMKALREEYGDTQNTYVISQYQRANDLLNAISTNLASTQENIMLSKLQQALKTSGNGTRDLTQEVADALTRYVEGKNTARDDVLLSTAGYTQEALESYKNSKQPITPRTVLNTLFGALQKYVNNANNDTTAS